MGRIDQTDEWSSVLHVGLALLALTLLAIVVFALITQNRINRMSRQVSSRDNMLALEAVEALRDENWHANGVLRQAQLAGAHLQAADLKEADLQRAFLVRASLQGANLAGANLQEAVLVRANLQGADLSAANLLGADLRGANLQDVIHLTDGQLAQADALRLATLPDANRYDGRFNLPGDIERARRGGLATDDYSAMSEWYGVSVEAYQRGQEWALSNRAVLYDNNASERVESPRRLIPGMIGFRASVFLSIVVIVWMLLLTRDAPSVSPDQSEPVVLSPRGR